MKIEKLELKNFRNHKETSIELDRLNIFTGPCGAGKTSIKAALEYLLTGRVQDWTDKRGAGATELIRNGGRRASVSAVLEGKKVTRSIPNKLEIEGAVGNTTVQDRLLSDFLGVSSDVVTALLNTSVFIKLPAAEQKNMLFNLLGTGISKNRLIKLMSETTRANADEVDECVQYAFNDQTDETHGVSILDELHDWAYENRRDANRDVKELEAAAAVSTTDDKSEADIDTSVVTKEQIEKIRNNISGAKLHLDELELRRTNLLTKKGQAVANEKRKVELQAEMDGLQKELAKLKKEAPLSIEEIGEQATDTAETLDVLIKSQSEKTAAISTAKEKLKALETTKEALKNKSDCPIFDMPCTMTKKQRDEAVKNINAEIKKLKVKLKRLEAQALEMQESKAKFEKLSKGLKDHQKKAENIDEKEKRFRHIPAEILKLETHKGIDDELLEIEERIKIGRAAVHMVEIEKARDNGNGDRLKKAKLDAYKWTKLVDIFGPSGIKTKLLKSAVQEFAAGLSRRLELLTDGMYKARVEIEENGFEIMINGRPAKLLSNSEKLRVGLIIQDALARLTGLKILVIDNADVLRGPAKLEFQNFISQIEKDYDTIFVFASVDEKPAAATGVFWVEGGKVA